MHPFQNRLAVSLAIGLATASAVSCLAAVVDPGRLTALATLVAFADQDPIFPYPKSGDRFTELIPTAGEQVKIENAGHFLQEDKPEEIVAAMRAELFS